MDKVHRQVITLDEIEDYQEEDYQSRSRSRYEDSYELSSLGSSDDEDYTSSNREGRYMFLEEFQEIQKDFNVKKKGQKSKLIRKKALIIEADEEVSEEEETEPLHFSFQVGQSIEDYKVLSYLNDGTFGRVLLVENKNKGQFAMKIIKAKPLYVECGKNEAKLVQKLNQRESLSIGKQRIVKIHQVFVYGDSLCIVFEKLRQSLYQKLQNQNFVGFDIKEIYQHLTQTLQALVYLHDEMGLTHTDLKTENIMIADDGSTKLIDFGGATPDNEVRVHLINTLQYRAPEVILGCYQWGHSSDIWCLGCIVVEMYTGRLFFKTKGDNQEHLWLIEKQCGKIPEHMISSSFFHKNVWSNSKQGTFQSLNNLIQPQHHLLKDLIERMIVIEPSRRITAQEALKHPFLKAR